MSFKILLLNPSHPVLQEKLMEAGFICVENFTDSKEQIEAIVHEYDGVILRSRINIDEAIVNKGKRLKFVAREGVGIEHIAVKYAKQQGIKVITSPEGSRDTVGEHALGMLLALLNNLVRADQQIRQGKWERESNRGIEIKGKTVGILGYGNMGRSFAKKISGFEANVIAYDKFKTGYGDKFATEASLETLFAEADILSIHIPYQEGNFHFIDGAFLTNFKKDIFVVNTARGLVLNTADLVEKMKAGQVRGAALDVLEYEEQSFDSWNFEELPTAFHYLVKAENVVLAPHIAGWSFESKEGHARVLAEKIISRWKVDGKRRTEA
ncbi:MAG: D-3-phosphoglycerate dehydrogenase [Saprospiraceae bacterium]|jgi:D-3-phosphoglycerate dehydrogenase